MPLNTRAINLPVGFPEFCGPDDLSEAIIVIRESNIMCHDGDNEWLSPISNDGIRRLITLAYYSSFVAEEGRYSSFRIINTKHSKGSDHYAADINTPINDVESLRRLAPAVSETDVALVVSEQEGKLHCMGFMFMSDLGWGTMIGRLGIIGIAQSPTLIVRIDGPGRLRVTEAPFTLTLAHGRIRQIADYVCVPQVKELWNRLAVQMIDRVASTHGEKSREYHGGSLELKDYIHKTWARVLAIAINKRHGGAFVILPAEGDPKDFDIHCKYSTRVQFMDAIFQLWISCVDYVEASDDHERDKAANVWNRRQAALFAKAEFIAGLSSVDGCVVLDQNLQVLGFGGEIRVDSKKVENAPRALRDIVTGELTPEEELDQFGTRHRSAYRLAKLHPGTIVFVISQDGDLRIFCSNKNDVFGFSNLYAWVHQYEVE